MTSAAIQTEELARIPRSYKRKGQPEHKLVNGKNEMTFKNVADLCAFVAREINFSKKKYSTFATDVGCAHGTVSRMATGQTRYPRAETVFAMLRCLGYEVVVRGA